MQSTSYMKIVEPPLTHFHQNTYSKQQQPYVTNEKIINIVKTKPQMNFISPEEMLQVLLYQIHTNQSEEQIHYDHNVNHKEEMQISQQIKNFRMQINNLRSEVVEVQNLLNIRDSLYQQLDHLRQQRQQIEVQIQSIGVDKSQDIKMSGGYQEMNERLRRRIYEIREYINKMTEQNMKIGAGIATHKYQNQEEEIYHFKRHIEKPPINERTLYDDKKYNKTNFQRMMSNLHDKQQQAWRRVRRQQQDIDRRNKQRRSIKGNNTYYSPNARTYYSPGRQIY